MKPVVRIAQVGSNKRRTDGDITRWLIALDWLMKDKVVPRGFKHDIINLKYGRDFLAEEEEYSIVVLHDIYDGKVLPCQFKGFSRAAREVLVTSPLQNVETWRLRLMNTKAKYVFVFEMQISCLNGWMLGDIPGYETPYRGTDFTVYRKENA